MNLHYSNRRAFEKSLPEVLEQFYDAETLWEIACEQVYALVGEPQPYKQPKKGLLIELLLDVFKSDETLEALLRSMPDEVYTTLKQLAWDGDQEQETLESGLGVEMTYRKTVLPMDYYEYESAPILLKAGYEWLALDEDSSSARSDARVMVRLPPAVRSRFRECMPKPFGYDVRLL